MLIMIGGAARTGKTMLADRLLLEQGLPFLNLDVLKMGLVRAVPAYGLNPNVGALGVGEHMWPLIYEMCRSLLFDQQNYVLEGELLPRLVASLCDVYPKQVCACFLGYTRITAADKIQAIRHHAGLPNDWSAEYSDDALLQIVEREIGFSHYLRAECERYQLPYFDSSEDFSATMGRVVAYIRAWGLGFGV